MSQLISVEGDENTHIEGALTASNNTGKVFIQGKKVNYLDAVGLPDLEFHPPPPTDASTASSKVFAEGIAVHRHGDARYCGATTIVTGQNKVFAG